MIKTTKPFNFAFGVFEIYNKIDFVYEKHLKYNVRLIITSIRALRNIEWY
jgi:hypothetical protein